jgi:N6-L-threonylcarbamoyladenine synthase
VKNVILSIESSCDDTSIGLTEIETVRPIFYRKVSQELEHSAYGGVVPELASRLHIEIFPKLIKEVTILLKNDFNLKAIAVTTEPGLSVTLIEGVVVAKALSISYGVPLISVNHLVGHIYSTFIDEVELKNNFLTLLVSGGHTQLIKIENILYKDSFKVIGSSLDDSLGESFDKVAKMLNLGYPGGPIIEKLALNGNENRFNFSVPLSQSSKIAFSYSGLKNSVRLAIEKEKSLNSTLNEQFICDLSASFQKVATDHILQKIKKYLKNSHNKFEYLSIVGGVSANKYIREKISSFLKNKFNITTIYPKIEYCSDNALMIGRYGVELYKQKKFSELNEINIKTKSIF